MVCFFLFTSLTFTYWFACLLSSFVSNFYSKRVGIAMMEPCYILAGTTFQLTWNNVPAYVEHLYSMLDPTRKSLK